MVIAGPELGVAATAMRRAAASLGDAVADRPRPEIFRCPLITNSLSCCAIVFRGKESLVEITLMMSAGVGKRISLSE